MTRYQDRESPIGGTVASAWHVDSVGQVLELDEPDSAPQFRSYDNWGELVSAYWNDTTGSLPVQHRLVSVYDALGRMMHHEELKNGVTDPETVNDYLYDSGITADPQVTPTLVLGRLASAKAPTGQILFSYDDFGRANARTFIDQQGVHYIEKTTFNADGTPSELELLLPDTGYDKEAFKYTYDSAARLRSLKFFQGSNNLDLYEASVIDPFGRVRQAKYGAKVDYAADYADLGRRLMKDVTVSSPLGARRIEFSMADPLEREEKRREIKDNGSAGAEINATYDQLGRLLVRTVQNPSSNKLAGQGFAYDPLGNIVAVNDQQGAGDVAFNYDNNDRDRICRIGYGNGGLGGTACNVVYDGVGNITKEATPTGSRDLFFYASGRVRKNEEHHATSQFRYDALGELQELDIEGTGVADTRHDRHYGRLIERHDAVVGGSTQSYIARQIPGARSIVASRRGNGNDWIFYFGEARGNRFFTDQNGAFLQDVDYQPFGEAKSSGAQPGSQEYTSAQWNGGDALAAFGLSYLGARLYDPVIGRFLSRDPLLVSRTAATTNPYAFAMNDPVNRADSTGLDVGAECPICEPSGLQWSLGSLPGLGGPPSPPSHANPQAGESSSPSASVPIVQLANGCIATCPTCCHGPNDGKPRWFDPGYFIPIPDDKYHPDNSPGILEVIHNYFTDSITDGLTSAFTTTVAGVHDIYGIPRPSSAYISADVRPGIHTTASAGVTIVELLLALTAGGGRPQKG
jgi:RHS repeat-associated protein